jgi:hypothetical protein
MSQIKNNWDDFTRKNYSRLLKMASMSYELGTVSNWQNKSLTGLWRHDVDCSPQSALALAKIEHENAIQATYYFNLRSEFYNLLEPAVISIVHAIDAMGHEVGIHFDAAAVDISSLQKLEAALLKEKKVFEALIGIKPMSFSFHNPSDTTSHFKDNFYGGLINAYSSALLKHFSYCSDSNGYWRHTPLEEFLQLKYSRICVLTHPEWWQNEPMSPRDRIVRSVEGRAISTLSRYDETLRKFMRKNIRK